MISRVFICFFFFGLINNVLYVIILTAAHDLVSPRTPKSLILLADILPAFILKLLLPIFVNNAEHNKTQAITDAAEELENNDNNNNANNNIIGLGINYQLRLTVIVLLSSIGMFLTSLPVHLYIILFGIVLASLASGLGETTFLQLSHYYNNKNLNIAIHGWSSGTGGAGLVGAGLILLLTTVIKLPIDWVLRGCALFPMIHFWVYYGYLPSPTIDSINSSGNEENVQLISNENNDNNDNTVNERDTNIHVGDDQILDFENTIDLVDIFESKDNNTHTSSKLSFNQLFKKIGKYFFIFMLPLSLVYFAEYTINQGVAPTMLFPLHETPFTTFRDSYVVYGTIYQIGVFISRSSGSYVRFGNLYSMGFLQILNLVLCILQSIYFFIPNIWIIFILILYEGLLGGAAYVNTFMNVSEQISIHEREFALGCVGISDSFGIVLAASINLWLEPTLCEYQVSTGRDWCTLE